tara:strand:- start:230 stop:382 length:153 start_codon:yes stop_codon:yes gene_type:complete
MPPIKTIETRKLMSKIEFGILMLKIGKIANKKNSIKRRAKDILSTSIVEI